MRGGSPKGPGKRRKAQGKKVVDASLVHPKPVPLVSPKIVASPWSFELPVLRDDLVVENYRKLMEMVERVDDDSKLLEASGWEGRK
jgi:hypothetical protein